jgi:hypothetical protein
VHDPLHCARCARTFNTDRSSEIVDLTLTSGVTSRVYKESLWGGVEIFRYAQCIAIYLNAIDTNDVPAQVCHHYTFPGAGTRLSALYMSEVGDRALHGPASQVHTGQGAFCCLADRYVSMM